MVNEKGAGSQSESFSVQKIEIEKQGCVTAEANIFKTSVRIVIDSQFTTKKVQEILTDISGIGIQDTCKKYPDINIHPIPFEKKSLRKTLPQLLIDIFCKKESLGAEMIFCGARVQTHMEKKENGMRVVGKIRFREAAVEIKLDHPYTINDMPQILADLSAIGQMATVEKYPGILIGVSPAAWNKNFPKRPQGLIDPIHFAFVPRTPQKKD